MFVQYQILLVIAIFGISVEARRAAAAQIAEIDETLNSVIDVIRQINIDSLKPYEEQNGEILQLIQELNNLHKETVPLLFLLVNGPTCRKYLNVRSQDIRTVTKSIDRKVDKIKVAMNISASNFEVESAKNATAKLFQLSKQMFNISMELLETTKDAFNQSISQVIIIRPFKTKGLTPDELNLYLDRLNKRLANIEERVRLAMNVNDEFSISEREKELQLRSEIENIHHDMKFATRVNCTVQNLDESGAYMDALSHVTISDLLTALREIQMDLTAIMTHPKLAAYNKERIENEHHIVLKLINDIEKIYKVQNAKESELMQRIDQVLKTRDESKINRTNYESLRNIKNARIFIDRVYDISKTPLQTALTAAHNIYYFPASLAGIERAINNAVNHGQLNMSDTLPVAVTEIRKAMTDRFAVAFNTNHTYGDSVSLYLYNVYQLQKYYASVLLFQIARDIRQRRYIQNNEEYWLADVELFISSNLHLIFGSNCDMNLYDQFGKPERKRMLRKLYAYQEVLRLMSPGDEGILLRTSLLRRELQAYEAQRIHDEVVSIAMECSVLRPKYRTWVTNSVFGYDDKVTH